MLSYDALCSLMLSSALVCRIVADDVLQKLLHEAVASLLRPIETRDRVLQFFATLASLNRGRARMHVDPRTVGSDGVVLGALAILFRLCEPIMAPTSPMRAQIDKAYYMRQRRFDASNETRLNAAKEDIEEAARQAESAGEAYKANFITECFFLTAAFVHIGIIGCQGMERENARVLREIQQVIDTIQQRMQQLPVRSHMSFILLVCIPHLLFVVPLYVLPMGSYG